MHVDKDLEVNIHTHTSLTASNEQNTNLSVRPFLYMILTRKIKNQRARNNAVICSNSVWEFTIQYSSSLIRMQK